MLINDKLLKEIEKTSMKCNGIIEKLPSQVKSILTGKTNKSSQTTSSPGSSQIKIKK